LTDNSPQATTAESMHGITVTSEALLLQTFGDPRQYERFDGKKLQDGDFAIVINTDPGVILFLRPKVEGEVPETIFDGNVVMAHLLLGPNAGRGKKILDSLVGKEFRPELTQGLEMDGVTIPFWLILKV
jgi:hypothetical protein